MLHYGFPKQLHSDQGRNVESSVLTHVCKLARDRKTRTTLYHPKGNPVAEIFNRTLRQMLRTFTNEQKANWKAFVPACVHV